MGERVDPAVMPVDLGGDGWRLTQDAPDDVFAKETWRGRVDGLAAGIFVHCKTEFWVVLRRGDFDDEDAFYAEEPLVFVPTDGPALHATVKRFVAAWRAWAAALPPALVARLPLAAAVAVARVKEMARG